MTSKDLRHDYSYSTLFYQYQREGSKRSALALLPAIINTLRVTSVLDIGCGVGAWLNACVTLGVSDHLGVDGDYVDRSLLVIDKANFLPRDITQPFDFGRTFDMVQCLEVAEHIPPSASSILIDNIVKHGKKVLFSAAVPGQGGEGHINEQPYEFWRNLFAERGYRLFDFVRPLVKHSTEIEFWYRFNVLFFAHDDVIRTLPPNVTVSRVADGSLIRDFSPLTYRLRRFAMSSLPQPAVSRLAILKHKWATRLMNNQNR